MSRKRLLFFLAAFILTFLSIGAVLAETFILTDQEETLGQTFGLDSGDSAWTVDANTINAMKFTCPSAGNLTKIALQIDTPSTGERVYWPGRHVMVAIYDHNPTTDMPNNLLWGSNSTSLASGWMEWQTSPVSLNGDSVYWLAFWLDASADVRYQNGAGRHVLWYESYGSWPASVVGISSGDNTSQYVMLATYLTGAATPTASQTPEPIPTSSPTPVPSEMPQPTAAPTTSPSPTPMPSQTPELTPAPTPSQTPEPTATPTSIVVGSGGGTVLPIAAPAPTPTPTSTPEPTPTLAPTPTPTSAPIPTTTPAATYTHRPRRTPAPTPSPTSTATPAPMPSPTSTPTATPRPTSTPAPTPSPTSTAAPTPTPTPKPTPTPTPIPTPTPTPSPMPTPTPAPTATPTPTPTPAPAPVSGIWKPTAAAPIHWQWQIGEPLQIPNHLIPGVTVYDIDWEDSDASVVKALHDRGFIAIAYLEAGDWTSERADAGQFPASVIGNQIDGWSDKWLDIRSPVVRQIMAARLDVIKAKGFDAVEPDCIDGYTNDTGFPLTAQDQLDYNKWLAEQCHQRGLSVGLKGDIEQAVTLEPYFDWSLNEECYQYDECGNLLAFINANKAVFQVEYKATGQCSYMTSHHINSMRRDLDLTASGVRTPCIPDTQNTWN